MTHYSNDPDRISSLLNKLDGVTGSHPQWMARCPAHDDEHASLSISIKNGKILYHCHANCSPKRVTAELRNLGALPSRSEKIRVHREQKKPRAYVYCDEDRDALYRVVRRGKKFTQEKADGVGSWKTGKGIMKGVRRVPYRLPEFKNKKRVYIVEGEKDANALWEWGIPATTNPGGAGKWRKEFNKYFKNKQVRIIPDNDTPGETHAHDIAENLLSVAKSVKIIQLDVAKKGGDFSDWKAAGGTKEELRAIAKKTARLTRDGLIKLVQNEIDRLTSQIEQGYKELEESESGKLPKEKKKPTDDDKNQVQKLLALAKTDVEYFHTPDREAYAQIPVGSHRETWKIRSTGFKEWLRYQYFRETRKAPGSQVFLDALKTLAAIATYEGQTHEVYVRIARLGDCVYLDLCNSDWEVVEISADGWRVINDPPVRFKRSTSAKSLPRPESGGDLTMLRKFLNPHRWSKKGKPLRSATEAWMLRVAWLVKAMIPTGPFPVLVISGEYGTAKTTEARVLRDLIDPYKAKVRSLPRSERDIAISASQTHILAFDNLSWISSQQSDALCRLSTGGGLATRKLFTDQDEVIFESMRPIILTSIREIVVNHDLIDRGLFLDLPKIDKKLRKKEESFWEEFEEARPTLLGALCDAVAGALANYPNVKLKSLPRMADFAQWGVAVSQYMKWKKGRFIEVYESNRKQAIKRNLENDLIIQAILKLLNDEEEEVWEGTMTELLEALDQHVSDKMQKSRAWPGSPRGLSNRLRDAKSFLREVGVHFTSLNKDTRHETRGQRLLRLKRKKTPKLF